MVQASTPWVDTSVAPEDLLPAWIWQGTWVTGRTYAVNAALEHDGSTWVCVKSHTSDAINEPPDDPSVNPTTEFWELMALGGALISWKGDWSSIVTYVLNDAVEYLGSAYIALQSTLNEPPADNPASWDLIVAGQIGTGSGYTQTFSASTNTSVDPGDNNFTINGTDLEIATDDLNREGTDISAWIADFAGGTTPGDLGQITIKESENPDTIWKRYSLSAVIVETGFTRLTVVLVDSAGAFTASQAYSIEFARTGDKGVDGAGAGDVIGPAVAVDSNIAAFDTTTGKLIKDAGAAVADLVPKTLFDADTILKADTDDTPVALTVAEQTLVGRITAGDITGLTAAEVRTLLNVEDGSQANDVDSVFTRTGAVVAATGDYAASQVDNDSGVAGAGVDDALDNLDTDKAPNAGNAVLGTAQVFTAGQRKLITDLIVATLTYDWAAEDLQDSNDFDLGTFTDARILNVPPNMSPLTTHTAQAGEITGETGVGGSLVFGAGWQFPDGTAPTIGASTEFTLYYRSFTLDGATQINRIADLQGWA